MARETVHIPFTFLTLQPPSHAMRWGGRGAGRPRRDAGSRPSARCTRFIASSGHVVAMLELRVRPRPCAVDRTFRFYQAEGEI